MKKLLFSLLSVFLVVSLPSVYGQGDSITLDIEKPKYFEGDLIHISGSVPEILFGKEINLMILGPSGDVISVFNLIVDTNKQFQINLTADEEFFDNVGTYVVLARYGIENEIAKDTFSFDQKNKFLYSKESKQNVLLNFDFVKPGKQKIQEHIDYKITVKQNGKNVFGPTPITHSASGSVSIPITIAERQLHDVLVEVDGVMFQPVPPETSSFKIMTGGETILSEFTSKNSLKINMAINKDPSPDPNIVPDWVKNNAKWWSNGQIDDASFTGAIQYLIAEKIVDIPDLPYPASWMDKDVPDWVKNNAKWWADDLIKEDDFIKGIKYLVEKGIIQVNQV